MADTNLKGIIVSVPNAPEVPTDTQGIAKIPSVHRGKVKVSARLPGAAARTVTVDADIHEIGRAHV